MKNQHVPIIFIIDENRIYRQMLQESLHATINSHVTAFQNPRDCIQYKDLQPDLIITEFSFSEESMQGLTLLNELMLKYPRTRIIFLTSNGDVESAIKAIRRGATDYIIKSKYAPLKLIRRVKTIVKYKEFQNKSLIVSRLIITSAGILAAVMIGLVLLYTH